MDGAVALPSASPPAADAAGETISDAAIGQQEESDPSFRPLMACPSLLPRRAGVTLLEELLFVQGLLQRAPLLRDFLTQLFAWKGLAPPKGVSQTMLARNALDLYYVLGLIAPTRLDAERVKGIGRWQFDPGALSQQCGASLKQRLWGMGEAFATLVRGASITDEHLARRMFTTERQAGWHLEEARNRLSLLHELCLVAWNGADYEATSLLPTIQQIAPVSPGSTSGHSLRTITPIPEVASSNYPDPPAPTQLQLREGCVIPSVSTDIPRAPTTHARGKNGLVPLPDLLAELDLLEDLH